MLRPILGIFKRKLKYLVIDYFYKDSLRVYWWRGEHNFGDAINPIVIKALTGKRVFWVDPKVYEKKHYFVIGSILHHNVNKHSIVWGSGFISEKSKCFEKPLKISAVRGPKTRQKLLNMGIDCPEVYGDPALLLPRIYLPKIKKKYKLGIIPHYFDKNHSWLKGLENEQNIKILDIQKSDPFKIIDDLLSCEKIASSSLHGIIVADAYSIPSIWIRFSDKVSGGNFKFVDYFMSVKRKDREPLLINNNILLDDLYSQFYDYQIDIDLELLIKSCPFEFEKGIMKGS